METLIKGLNAERYGNNAEKGVQSSDKPNEALIKQYENVRFLFNTADKTSQTMAMDTSDSNGLPKWKVQNINSRFIYQLSMSVNGHRNDIWFDPKLIRFDPKQNRTFTFDDKCNQMTSPTSTFEVLNTPPTTQCIPLPPYPGTQYIYELSGPLDGSLDKYLKPNDDKGRLILTISPDNNNGATIVGVHLELTSK